MPKKKKDKENYGFGKENYAGGKGGKCKPA